jgi:hypothetical protein
LNGGDLTAGSTFEVQGGRLEGVNTLTSGTAPITISGGTVAPGLSAGTLTVSGDYTQDASSTLEIELDGFGAGLPGGYDQLAVTGTATLAGTLHISLNFDAPIGTIFDIITAGSHTGMFIDPPTISGTLPPGTTFEIDYSSPDRVTARLTSFVPECCTYDTTFEALAAAEVNVVATGDLDNDGDNDVVALIPGPDAVTDGFFQVFLNNGMSGDDFALVPTTAVTAGPDPTGLALGLLDGDAFLDLAVTTRGDDSTLVYINDTTGPDHFANPPITITAPGVIVAPSAVVAADLTGDAKIDLAVASQGTDDVVILDNTTADDADSAGATFIVDQVIEVGLQPLVLDVRDLDDDRDLDLVSANIGDDTISILENGPTMFEPQLSLPAGAGPAELAIGDLDGNGFEDVVCVSSATNRLTVVLNDGALAFQPFFEIEVGPQPISVDAADLDVDGDVDLALVANDTKSGRVVQLIENLSGPTGFELSDPEDVDVPADPNFAVIEDMDGNAFPDIVTGNADDGGTGGSVTVLLAALPCADLNGDGVVNFTDILLAIGDWGPCPALPEPCPTDINGDGIVNFGDILALIGMWGDCP